MGHKKVLEEKGDFLKELHMPKLLHAYLSLYC